MPVSALGSFEIGRLNILFLSLYKLACIITLTQSLIVIFTICLLMFVSKYVLAVE